MYILTVMSVRHYPLADLSKATRSFRSLAVSDESCRKSSVRFASHFSYGIVHLVDEIGSLHGREGISSPSYNSFPGALFRT